MNKKEEDLSEELKEAIKAYTTHRNNFSTYPEGWKLLNMKPDINKRFLDVLDRLFSEIDKLRIETTREFMQLQNELARVKEDRKNIVFERDQLRSEFDHQTLTEEEASHYLGLAQSTLRQARMKKRKNEINKMQSPPFLKLGKKVLYVKTDLDKWVQEHKVKTGKS